MTGVAIRASKNKELRQTAVGASMSGLLGGISEPSLYGVVLRYKRVIPLILVPAVVGGATISLLEVKSHAFAFTSLLSIPAMQPSALYALGLAIAFFGAMTGVLLFGYESRSKKDGQTAAETGSEGEPKAAGADEADAAKKTGTAAAAAKAAPAKPVVESGTVYELTAPLEGKAVALEEVPDPVFASGKLGKGVAIEPTGTAVVAPADAKVSATLPSGHAVGLKFENGVEMLVHVGLDTVQLDGKGFEVKVAKGDSVKAGQELLTFDPTVIKEAGYPLITPVLITNTNKFADVEGLPGAATPESTVIRVTTK